MRRDLPAQFPSRQRQFSLSFLPARVRGPSDTGLASPQLILPTTHADRIHISRPNQPALVLRLDPGLPWIFLPGGIAKEQRVQRHAYVSRYLITGSHHNHCYDDGIQVREKDLVIGLDSSTTATKAIAWRRDGKVAGTGRAPIPLASLGNNRYEQNPEDWWHSTCLALKELFQQVNPRRWRQSPSPISERLSFPLDAHGNAVRPAIVMARSALRRRSSLARR